jgi:aryl-alcohol dehydrogenase-like predicted oxidoreductase
VRTRPLGQTEIAVSELALGTWGLSGEGYGPVDAAERDRVIERALDLGITTFETADVYGRGAMESALGAKVGAKPGTFLVTKVGTVRPGDDMAHVIKCFEPAYLREAVEKCRGRLRRDKIDVVLLHNPSATTMLQGDAARAMQELKEHGKIGAWGVSAGDKLVARRALSLGAGVVELAYNVFFSRDFHDLAGEIVAAKAGVLARSVLAYGLLAGHYAKGHSFAAPDHRADRWTAAELEVRLRQLDAVRPLVSGPVLTMRAAALRFALANQLVSTAVLGPRDVSQLEQLVREAGDEPPYLPEAALTRLTTDLDDMGVVT